VYYLGTIQGGSGAYNNAGTGASGTNTFEIPKTTKSIYLVPSVSGMQFACFGHTGGTLLVASGRGAPLSGPDLLNGPFRLDGNSFGIAPIVSIYSASGIVTCRVFASPTS
jgi:hypothetical protein